MPRTIDADYNTHLQGAVTTTTRCLKIKRTDGEIFAFTKLDADLSINLGDGDGAVTYTAGNSGRLSAVEHVAGLSPDNFSIDGVLSDDAISMEDLRAGLFNSAFYTLFECNYEDLTQDPLILQTGWLGEIVIRDNDFAIEMRPLTDAFSQRVGELVSPLCRADLGDARCKIPVRPDDVERSTAYEVGDFVFGFGATTAAPVFLTITNPGAESGVTGWTNEVGTLATRTASPSPHGGSAYFTFAAAADGTARQDIAIPLANQAAVDAGTLDARLTWYQNAFGADQGEMIVAFYDGSAVQIGSDTAAGLTAPSSWTLRTIQVAIPTLTRTIRIKMRAHRLAGTNIDGYFDDIVLSLRDNAGSATDRLPNVYFECTVAGTTDSSAVDYDPTIGNTTVDDSASFIARNGWLRQGEVTESSDTRHLVATIDEARAVNDWFNYGIITWITGENAGLKGEVKDWVQSTGAIELFLPMPYTIAIGDLFDITPGCDKRHATCKDKFDNILNRRAEDFVPGVDVALDYPDAS
jgi:hypothetical protein